MSHIVFFTLFNKTWQSPWLIIINFKFVSILDSTGLRITCKPAATSTLARWL